MGPTALVVVPQVHHERYDQNDALASMGMGDLEARRLVVGGAIFDVITLADERVALEPAVRIDQYTDEASGDETTRTLLSPRAGGRVSVTHDVDLRASAGRYHRAPTFLEAFGDHGFLFGNPDLRPEHGTAGDAGVLWRGPIRADASLHAAWVDDLILLTQNAQGTVRASNVGRARLWGVEVGLSARPWSRLRTKASYAYLSPTNLDDGRQLPGRARHEAYGRIDAGPQEAGPLLLGAFTEVDATAGMVLDAANLRPIPPRAFLGAGVVLQPRRAREWSLTLEGKNLTNARTETVELLPSGRHVTMAVQDYVGYALPGRAFYATARKTF
jgi:iron complex outermembrane receptor protein